VASSIETTIVSSPEIDKVYVEFRFDCEQFASLIDTTHGLELEVYPRRSERNWRFGIDEIIDALQRAKKSLSS